MGLVPWRAKMDRVLGEGFWILGDESDHSFQPFSRIGSGFRRCSRKRHLWKEWGGDPKKNAGFPLDFP